jgi:hypothetical protein
VKISPIALAAVLCAAVLPAHSQIKHLPLSDTTAPPAVIVGVTPTRLASLDTATIAATFISAGTARGPFTATLELRPHTGGHALTAVQGGFLLRKGQRLSVYWEWRAGAALPPGTYMVRVRLSDRTRRALTSGTARAPLIVARHP